MTSSFHSWNSAHYFEFWRLARSEPVVLSYAEAIPRAPVNVEDELYEQVTDRFRKRELVELTTLGHWENYRARFHRAFDRNAQGILVGVSCLCRLDERYKSVGFPGYFV